MRMQVVHCHPLTESFDHALYLAIVEALQKGGHKVIGTDLYRDGFSPIMTEEERRSYMTNEYKPEHGLAYVEALRTTEGIIFCFPHWWLTMPAVLKGYFDRVWGPGTAFVYDGSGNIKPNLHNVRFMAVVTTFGSPWWYVNLLAGNPGRKVFKHAIEILCSPKLHTKWFTMYGMDKSTENQRAAFLAKVSKSFRALEL